MKSEKTMRNKTANAGLVIALALGCILVFWASVVLLAALLAGCTVTPKTVRASAPSFDGNAQNSGVIARMPDGSYNVTRHWQERFVFLALSYGTNFSPHVSPDLDAEVLTNGTFLVPAQAVADFGKMNLLYKGKPK